MWTHFCGGKYLEMKVFNWVKDMPVFSFIFFSHFVWMKDFTVCNSLQFSNFTLMNSYNCIITPFNPPPLYCPSPFPSSHGRSLGCALYMWVCLFFVIFVSLLSFYVPPITDTQYLPFSFCLISLSIMPSKSINVAANGKISFFLMVE